MDIFTISLASFLASGLAFFSGFGLGTLLLPVFALFMPISVAIAATAIVHLANNLFKAALVGKFAHWPVVVRFGLPAVLAAFAGAGILNLLTRIPPLFAYELFGHTFSVSPVQLIIGLLIMLFAAFELIPAFLRLAFDPRFLPLGGVLSGFFGGLSGHQGALRSAFLIRSGLEKEAFIGTTVMTSVLVDFSRLLVYGQTFLKNPGDLWAHENGLSLVIAGTIAALLGSFLGAKFLHKTTLKDIQYLVGGLLLLTGALLASGMI